MSGTRKFLKTHEWVEIQGSLAVVGISDDAQCSMGDLTYVELPKIGTVFEQGDACCVIEAVKAASDMFTPVGGTVVAINKRLEKKPGLINQSPYTDGWIFKMTGFSGLDSPELLDEEGYHRFIAGDDRSQTVRI